MNIDESNLQLERVEDTTSDDPRHLKRVGLLQALYVTGFPDQSLDLLDVDYDQDDFRGVQEHLEEIDAKIALVAPERPVSEIARTDLNIIRLILYEAQNKNTPIKVLIDEGVELAKEFGGEHSFAFVNAILEKILLADKSKTVD